MTDDIKRVIERLRRDTDWPDVIRVCDALEAADKDRAAAIAEAVRVRTVECAEVAYQLAATCGNTQGACDKLKNAILALNAPPAPAYPFEKPCQCWEAHEKDWLHLPKQFGEMTFAVHRDYTHCPFCGSKRVTKGE